MHQKSNFLNYLETLDALSALAGERVGVAFRRKEGVAPSIAVVGVLGNASLETEWTTREGREDWHGIAFFPVADPGASESTPHIGVGPGFYLRADDLDSAWLFNRTLFIDLLGGDSLIVDPLFAPTGAEPSSGPQA